MTTATLDGAVRGPGGADVLAATAPSSTARDSGRLACTSPSWAGPTSYPVVRGSRVRYEAERGTLNGAEVRSGAAGASQGEVAAKIDYADSWVDVRVYAPVAGAYTATWPTPPVSATRSTGHGERRHAARLNYPDPAGTTGPRCRSASP